MPFLRQHAAAFAAERGDQQREWTRRGVHVAVGRSRPQKGRPAGGPSGSGCVSARRDRRTGTEPPHARPRHTARSRRSSRPRWRPDRSPQRVGIRLHRERRTTREPDAGVIAGADFVVDAETGAHYALAALGAFRRRRRARDVGAPAGRHSAPAFADPRLMPVPSRQFDRKCCGWPGQVTSRFLSRRGWP
jgi:hypothetical protein